MAAARANSPPVLRRWRSADRLPDGQAIYYSANRTADWQRDIQNSEIYRVNVASGTIDTLTSRAGPDNGPVVSPNGKFVAYVGFDDKNRSYEVMQLYVMRADGSDIRALTPKLDRDIDTVYWLGNDTLVVSYDDHGAKRVAKVGLNGTITPLLDNVVGGADLDRPYTGGSRSRSRQDRRYRLSPAAMRCMPADVLRS